ncbi:PRA1 family protein E [Hibiscus syriacus]|uniref:PRA1 family protein E n=1 Tax=Hibiscus syriacus TaxID=106335 RepID=A0A6A2Z6W8_HIBSY|nr:PRA1 family protein E [Hibiscus syriacus]
MVKDVERMKMGTTSISSLCEFETEELQRMPLVPPPLMKNWRYLSKQLSLGETSREMAWERRRRQILRQQRGKNGLTDDDLHELRGCIELGFGFNEEDGQKLCITLPALDLYFAVNRQLSPSPPESGRSSSTSSLGGRSSSFDRSVRNNPQQVKTKLRNWAQAVIGVATDHLFKNKWVDRIPYFLPDLRLIRDVSDSGVGYSQGRASTLELPFRPPWPENGGHRLAAAHRRWSTMKPVSLKSVLFPQPKNPSRSSKIALKNADLGNRKPDVGDVLREGASTGYCGAGARVLLGFSGQPLDTICCGPGPFVVKLNLRCLESNIPRCEVEIGSEIEKCLLTTSGPFVVNGPFVVKLNLRCLESNILRCEVEIGSEIEKCLLTTSGPFVVKLNLRCLESNILRCEVEIGSEIEKCLLTTSGPFVVKLNLRCLESNILRCEVEIGSEIEKCLLTTSGPFVVKLNLRCLESNILRYEVEIGSG